MKTQREEALPHSTVTQSDGAVVLVEGVSDQRALEALARRRGLDLDADGISIVPIGGAQAIGNFLDLFGPRGLGLKLAGLCDAPEEHHFRRGLERAGLGSDLTRAGMERLGFYVCVANLEDELIRALGTAAVEQIVADQGDLRSFRTYQKQPAHRQRTSAEQLWGFMWNRKIRYAPLLVDALDLTRVPPPLERLLAHVSRAGSQIVDRLGQDVRMDDAERRAQIRRYWDQTGHDQDLSHDIFHDDAVLEFPQSGERFEGVANFREWRRQYPAGVELQIRELRGEGDLWVVEGSIRYDGGPPHPGVSILEFRGDKVARETIYVTERWDAPEWRARWRAAP